MLRRSDSVFGFRSRSSPAAFTLVELILVMALLATLLAIVAPALSRSAHGRRLRQEATRLLAATEYARDEAVSQGVPMVLWIDSDGGSYGVEPKPGYPADESRAKEFQIDAELHFEDLDETNAEDGLIYAVEFAPDGTPDDSSAEILRIVNRSDEGMSVRRTEDRWGYELIEEGAL